MTNYYKPLWAILTLMAFIILKFYKAKVSDTTTIVNNLPEETITRTDESLTRQLLYENEQTRLVLHKKFMSTFLEHSDRSFKIHILLYKCQTVKDINPLSPDIKITTIKVAEKLSQLHQNPPTAISYSMVYVFVIILLILLVIAAVDVSKNYNDAQELSLRRYSLADYAVDARAKRKLSKIAAFARHNSTSSVSSAQSSFDQSNNLPTTPVRKLSSTSHNSSLDMSNKTRRCSVPVSIAQQFIKQQQMKNTLRRQSTDSGEDNESPDRAENKRRVRMIHRH
jgi:hypothetical protein